MRLIDADAIEKKLDEERKWLVEQNMKGTENILVHYLMRNLWEAPTVDAVPVVRCKDCVSFHYSGMGGDNGILYCAKGIEMQPTDFCSYGERKDNEID